MSGHGAAPVDQTVELRDRRPGHAATAALLTDPAMRRHRGRPEEVSMLEVETRNIEGQPTAIGSAGPFTVIFDRPIEGGGGGLGFNGGQLLYLAVAGCISNDLFRQASAEGIALRRVRVKVRGEFSGEPAVSEEIEYDVEIDGDASPDRLQALVEKVDRIAEIPNSLRGGTPVRLRSARVRSASSA